MVEPHQVILQCMECFVGFGTGVDDQGTSHLTYVTVMHVPWMLFGSHCFGHREGWILGMRIANEENKTIWRCDTLLPTARGLGEIFLPFRKTLTIKQNNTNFCILIKSPTDKIPFKHSITHVLFTTHSLPWIKNKVLRP